MDKALELLRERLQIILRKDGLSRTALDDLAGLTRGRVHAVLRNDRPSMPSADVVARIATATGRTTDWLLGLSNVEMAPADVLAEELAPYELPNAKQRLIARLKQTIADVEADWPDGP